MKPDENTHNPENSTNPTPEAPKIFALKKQDGGWRISRKSFLEAASAIVGGAALTGYVPPRRPVPRSSSSQATGVVGHTQGTGAIYAHEKAVRSLAISPDGKWLVSGGEEGKVKLWALPNGALAKSVAASSTSVNALACSPDGKKLAIQSGGISLWELPDLTKGKTLESSGGEFSVLPKPLAISPDGRLLASVASEGVKLWRLPTGTLSDTGIKKGANALAFTPDGTTLAIADHRGGIELCSIISGKRLLSISGPSANADPKELGLNAFHRLAITPDGRLIVAARYKSNIEIFALSSGQVVWTIKKEGESLTKQTLALAISPDGMLLASGGHEKSIELWSLSDGKLQQTLLGHSGPVNALAISPDGTLLASGSDDKTIRLWSLPQGKQLLCLLDLEASYKTTQGVQYKSVNQYGQTITYTLPCGSPIPAGAVCICNCVPGSLTMPAHHTQSFSPTGVCTCDLVCTCQSVCSCVSVCTCQAVGSPGGSGGYGGHYWYPN